MKYNPQKIERKWQRIWAKSGLYRAKDFSKKSKSYVLDMFPYPSGEGFHVGHVLGYTASDIIARYRRMKGHNVLHPMGWDAFGLPAENFAIKHKIHPRVAVSRNIKRFKKQLEMLGLGYDWEREINTTDPEYYKWTQWIFLKLFEKGLAYEATVPINWCPKDKTGLANEEVVDGCCERCGTPVERKDMRQWLLRITEYADRLLNDLDLLDWPEKIKLMQRNWIGRSEGAEIEFRIKNQESRIKVFTTRPDTLFGATYVVLAPEHEIISNIKHQISNIKEIEEYIEETKHKTERQRVSEEEKEKTGVEVKGVKAINPVNGEEIPIFVADYVLGGYGTGAIMAVPAHDRRDFEFAKKFNLPVKMVICPNYPEPRCPVLDKAYEEKGVLVDSGEFTGMPNEKAKADITKWLANKGLAKKTVSYKLRDWVFSRQRYWGEPIPLVFCEHCADKIKNQSASWRTKIKNKEFSKGELLNPGWIAVSEKDLPVELPKVKYYEPTGTGESPLANISKWVNVRCPRCKGPAKRETNTMPQWAGSCWYYLAYLVRKNSKFEIRNSKLIDYWMPVDLYIGGVEHAVLHLLYARFWHKFLYDIGAVSTKEPFQKLVNQGMMLGSDHQKMSKSRGNVVSAESAVKQYGADTLRTYEMFMGPLEESKPWSEQGVVGISRFLNRVHKLISNFSRFARSGEARQFPISKKNSKTKPQNSEFEKLLQKTIKKVTEDIENFRFNTAISAMMVLVNEMEKVSQFSVVSCQLLVKLLAPFAPHLAEDLWHQLGSKKSVHLEKWPEYDPALVKKETFILIVQINGKVRDQFEARVGISEEEAKHLTMRRKNVTNWIMGKSARKIIFVPDKLINIVV